VTDAPVFHDVETPDFIKFAERVIRAAGRRVGEGDIDALPLLAGLRENIARAEDVAIAGLRAEGYTLQEIADRLGVTYQAIQRRTRIHPQPEVVPALVIDLRSDLAATG
jgi:hypothetical protein